MYTVKERILGIITGITDSVLTDETADYSTNQLVGYSLVIRPDEGTTAIPILSNTKSTIVVSGGLFAVGINDDPYVAEKTQTRVGKILSTTLSVDATLAATTISVASTANWTVGDGIYLTDGTNTFNSTVASIGVGTLTLNNALTAGFTSAATTVYYHWISDDLSARFYLKNGTTAFVPGDSLYADTYAQAKDIKLRPENFPRLSAANLVVSTVGGAK